MRDESVEAKELEGVNAGDIAQPTKPKHELDGRELDGVIKEMWDRQKDLSGAKKGGGVKDLTSELGRVRDDLRRAKTSILQALAPSRRRLNGKYANEIPAPELQAMIQLLRERRVGQPLLDLLAKAEGIRFVDQDALISDLVCQYHNWWQIQDEDRRRTIEDEVDQMAIEAGCYHGSAMMALAMAHETAERLVRNASRSQEGSS